MAYLKTTKPFGVNPPLKEDRMNVIQVINGDSWVIDADLHNPITMAPATWETTVAEFFLTENRFTVPAIWKGVWMDGIYPDEHVAGLVHIKVPKSITKLLRRGIYAFSLRVTDIVDDFTETELIGHFQVEYEPSSDLHDIPYRPNSGKTEDSQKPEEMKVVYVMRGSVKRFSDLPKHPEEGDVWNIVEPVEDVPGGTNWVWNGKNWDALGGRITPESVESAIRAGKFSVIKFDEYGNPYVIEPEKL